MASPAQAVANLANAQHSTGPRTEAGKQKAARNALKHGLTAAATLIPGEDPETLELFHQGVIASLHPANPAEAALVDQLVDQQWRLRRIGRLEAEILSEEEIDFKKLNILSLHSSRLARAASITLKDLMALQKARKAEAKTRPVKPETIGFVLKPEETDTETTRKPTQQNPIRVHPC